MRRIGTRRPMTMGAGGVVAAAPFAPSTLAGLTLWLDASDSSTITTSGSDVTAWADKSDSGNTLASTGSPPELLSASENSLDAIGFDGTEFLVDSSPSSNLSGGSDITVCAIVANTSGATSRAAVSVWSDSGNQGCWLLGKRNVTEECFWAVSLAGSDINTKQVGDLGTAGAAHFLCGDYGNSGSGNSFDVRCDDTEATAAAPANDLFNSSANLVVGTVADNSTYAIGAWIGRIMEIVVYDTVLSDADRGSVQTYLEDKWGLS